MPLRRRQLFGWVLLGTVAVWGGLWLGRLDFGRRVSTDVLDLIPAGERSPELALVRELASQAGGRTMLFALTGQPGSGAPAEAARRFAAELARSPSFSEAVALDDPGARDAMGRELFAQRFTLLFPLWLHDRATAFAATPDQSAGFSAWLAGDAVAALGRFLATPEALAFQETIPSDPLLLLPGVLDRLKGSLSLVQPSGKNGAALVWARINASPLSEAGQGPVFAAIAQAGEKIRAGFPGVVVADTGVNRFAAASRARIEHEVAWLNSLSLAAVLAVALVFVRRLHRGLHLVPVVALAVLGAWVFALLAFDRLHILVFVIGSLLTGVAIDYGFYLYMQPPARPDEDYWAKVRRLLKPLLASCFTTVAGFALLLCSELPLLRQLGVFVGAGLVCALAAAVIYFSTLKDAFLPTRGFRGGQALPAVTRRWTRRVLIGAWMLALPGLALLKWRDDIRDLDIPSPALQREDARVRALFGDEEERTVYLTYGSTLAEARDSLAKLESWLRQHGGPALSFINLGAVMPTAAEHATALQFIRENPGFPGQLRAALDQAGFDPAGFAPFFDAYAHHAENAADTGLTRAVSSLHQRLTGPAGLLLHSGEPFAWFVTLASRAPSEAPPPELHTTTADQLQSLNRMFARYRTSALHLSLIGLAIVGAGVFLTYGLRDGVRIFAIPCGACLGLFGVFGWAGLPLNLFHLLGAFLGVCLTHNYSIFSVTSAFRREPPPVSVRVSALTAAASFGVLALSGIPVVRALGETVALMVLAALLVIEFEHFAPIAEKS